MQNRLPPLNALVVFEAAARHLSFTRAAQSLHVTQAAVSHQIKALEEWLGISLFHRIGRGHGLALTEAGREYLPRVNGALDSIRGATSAVMDRRRPRVLSIASLDSFAMLWLLPRLNRFPRAHPEFDVRIVAA
jgi:LysR family glycine cleavage system transcriptional activator